MIKKTLGISTFEGSWEKRKNEEEVRKKPYTVEPQMPPKIFKKRMVIKAQRFEGKLKKTSNKSEHSYH